MNRSNQSGFDEDFEASLHGDLDDDIEGLFSFGKRLILVILFVKFVVLLALGYAGYLLLDHFGVLVAGVPL